MIPILSQLLQSFQATQTFRQVLIAAQQTGQPLPNINLSNGTPLTNMVVRQVGVDVVFLTNPTTGQTVIANLNNIVSFGSMS